MKTCDVAEHVVRQPPAQRAAGEERVAERQGMSRATPVKTKAKSPSAWAAPRHPAPRSRTGALPPSQGRRSQAGHEDERVGQVRAHEQRARNRSVVGAKSEQHEAGADGRLGQDEEQRRPCPGYAPRAGVVLPSSSTEQWSYHGQQRQACLLHFWRELNRRGEARRTEQQVNEKQGLKRRPRKRDRQWRRARTHPGG